MRAPSYKHRDPCHTSPPFFTFTTFNMAGTQIYTLPDVAAGSDSVVEPLRDQIERGLAGTDQPTIPGNTESDKAWAYKRSVPTVVLYDAAGLR